MISKMAALLCAFYIFDVSFKRIPVYHKFPNGTKIKLRRLPKALKDFNPDHDVKFYLYTEFNKHEKHQIYPDRPLSLFISHFDFTKNTKILIHGWKNKDNSTFCQTVKDAYLKHMNVNVIVVDWHKLSRHRYHHSRKYMDLVAIRVAVLYDFLRQFLSSESIHIVGYSLGAHVAGIAGQVVKSGKVHRITGLDPAGPMISRLTTNGRLDKFDAQFVDVIHTSGFALGFYPPLGHADFYPNRGIPIQPGCGVDVFGKCSHRRSYYLFEESISNQSKFMAVACAGWKQFTRIQSPSQWHRMGEHVEYGIEGKFYLRTADCSPYGLGYSSNFSSLSANNSIKCSKRILNFIHNMKNKFKKAI